MEANTQIRPFLAADRLAVEMELGMANKKFRVHRFNLKMTADQSKLEQFLNSLEGEIVAIIPNVTIDILWIHKVDFLLIVEKTSQAAPE